MNRSNRLENDNVSDPGRVDFKGDHVFRVFSVRAWGQVVLVMLLFIELIIDGFVMWVRVEVWVIIGSVIFSLFLWVVLFGVVMWGGGLDVIFEVHGEHVRLSSQVRSLVFNRPHARVYRRGYLRDLVEFEARSLKLPNVFFIGLSVFFGLLSEVGVVFKDKLLSQVSPILGTDESSLIVIGIVVLGLVIAGVACLVLGVSVFGVSGYYFRLRFGYSGNRMVFGVGRGVFGVDNTWGFWGWGKDAERLFEVGESLLVRERI